MAAYRRVNGLKSHLLADCLYTEISSGPSARQQLRENFTLPSRPVSSASEIGLYE